MPFIGWDDEDHFAMLLAELTKVRVPTGEGDTFNKALENVSKLPDSDLEPRAILACLRDAEYVKPNHIIRESLNCSYARSSQRNLRDKMNSANQKSAKTTNTILSVFIATVLTI
jgi:hypothetical protein